jgi:hypothetical protein
MQDIGQLGRAHPAPGALLCSGSGRDSKLGGIIPATLADAFVGLTPVTSRDAPVRSAKPHPRFREAKQIVAMVDGECTLALVARQSHGIIVHKKPSNKRVCYLLSAS